MIKNRPALVLFEISDDRSMDDFTRMIGQMSYEKALDRSIVSVFNHPSSTQALRKLYVRHNLVATKEKISESRLFEMFDRLEKEPAQSSGYSFKKGDSRINVCLPIDIQITSLTENEITFMCREEMPLYSVLKLEIPVECFVVLIPSLQKLTPNIHGHHYMGFIFGGDAADGNYLRKFVNYILNNGLDRWKKINFDSRSSEVEQYPLDQVATAQEAPARELQEALERADNESGNARLKSKNLFSKL